MVVPISWGGGGGGGSGGFIRWWCPLVGVGWGGGSWGGGNGGSGVRLVGGSL